MNKELFNNNQLFNTKSIELQPVHTEQQSQIQNNNLQSTTHINQNQDSHQHSYYRPDIDGLRAIAILLVIIYHAWPQYLGGGFIGVDVFFVISGYLISQIIIKQTQKDKFSFVNFYSRRVKRIFPPLIVVLLFTLYVINNYSGNDQAKLGFKTLDASIIFGANIQVLLYNKGYFDPDLRINPLLHLWSLGVEQQFYIFWPCLLLFILSKFKKHALMIMGLYAGFSFSISIIAIYNDPRFAFYFPICRFWQMAIGGILAYLNININNSKLNDFISIFSVMAIIVTSFVINDNSLFPGFWALIPTLSSACIIQAKGKAFANKHILSNKVVVFIGKISYSLYLWHWPLLVFSRSFYPKGSTSIFSNLFLIILITFVLTILTHFIVQNPIRKMKGKKIVFALLLTMIMIGITSLVVNKTQTLYQVQDQNQDQITIFLKKAEEQMKPREQDYVVINGRKHPNSSKSKNRQKPTYQKILTPKTDQSRDYAMLGHQIVLEKVIDQNSIYNLKNRPYLHAYQVANEGKQNMLLIIGDSHSLKLSYRFQQLHKDSVKNNKKNQFPTVVTMSRWGDDTELLDYSIQFIKTFKTKRIFIVNHWLKRFCDYRPNESMMTCDPQNADNHNRRLLKYIGQFQALGVEVSLTAPSFQTGKLHPSLMVDANGVIEQNVKPFSLSQYNNRYKVVIDKYLQAVKSVNAQIIDLEDNICWDDVCEVLSPSGHGIYIDSNHYSKFYTRHWLSVVDHLVQF